MNGDQEIPADAITAAARALHIASCRIAASGGNCSEPNRYDIKIATIALDAAAPVIAAQAAAAERERLRRAVNSDGFQATIRAYVLEGSAADDVSDAVLDLLGGES